MPEDTGCPGPCFGVALPPETAFGRLLLRMNIEAVIAALGDHYSPDEAALIERMLREYAGTIPDKQLLSEIGLSLAIHRRQRPNK